MRGEMAPRRRAKRTKSDADANAAGAMVFLVFMVFALLSVVWFELGRFSNWSHIPLVLILVLLGALALAVIAGIGVLVHVDWSHVFRQLARRCGLPVAETGVVPQASSSGSRSAASRTTATLRGNTIVVHNNAAPVTIGAPTRDVTSGPTKARFTTSDITAATGSEYEAKAIECRQRLQGFRNLVATSDALPIETKTDALKELDGLRQSLNEGRPTPRRSTFQRHVERITELAKSAGGLFSAWQSIQPLIHEILDLIPPG
jgi:uncharacterized integral membrane protein